MTQRREALLDASVELFRTKGIHATAVGDITRAAGISKGAFYQHFDSKESLIGALLQRFREEMLEEAERRSSTVQAGPRSTLCAMIAAELEVAVDYQGFLHAVAMDFPPTSEGPVSAAMHELQRELGAWHEHILLEAFGPDVRRYVADLVVVLEGAVHHYLMTIFWQASTPPLERVADFIAECLRLIVAGGEHLVPVLSPEGTGAAGDPSILTRMTRELGATRVAVQGAPETTSGDLQTIDLLVEELGEGRPREFLVDALLTRLRSRPHLGAHVASTTTCWNDWKGAGQ